MSLVRRVSSAPPPRFFEVNARHVDPVFRAYVEKALKVLAATPTPTAQRTLRAITTGRVKLDQLSDLTRKDFGQVRKTLAGWGTSVSAEDYLTIHDGRTHAARAITKFISGYQWDNRIYLEEKLTPRALAGTLVHEVSHVMNSSEEHYRSDKAAFLEEYRAFYAQETFAGKKLSPAACRALKQRIIREYEFKNVSPDDVPDVPKNRVVW